MNIIFKGKKISVTKVQGVAAHVKIVRAGVRTKFVDGLGQAYVKISNVWHQFPQGVEY